MSAAGRPAEKTAKEDKMEIRKERQETAGTPSPEELAEINRFARTPLAAEEVYAFSLRLCDNEVDRDFERFDEAALGTLGDLFVGKSGIFDHRWSAEGQTARLYRTEVVRERAKDQAPMDRVIGAYPPERVEKDFLAHVLGKHEPSHRHTDPLAALKCAALVGEVIGALANAHDCKRRRDAT